MLAMLSPPRYPSRIAERCASRYGAVRDRANFSNSVLSSSVRRRARPEIFNSDQGSQFTSERFTGELQQRGISISMDGRGRCFDNIFIERLWRSLKQEEVYLKDYQLMSEACAGIERWFQFYNHRRPHMSLNYRTPAAIYKEGGVA
jgi:putative transposase